MIGIAVYAISANLCFTAGWLIEPVVRKAWPQEVDRFATMSFCLGLILSVLLTLGPALIFGAAGIFALAQRASPDFSPRVGVWNVVEFLAVLAPYSGTEREPIWFGAFCWGSGNAVTLDGGDTHPVVLRVRSK